MKSKSQKRKNKKHSNAFFEQMKVNSMYNIDEKTGIRVSVRNQTARLKAKIDKKLNKYPKLGGKNE